MRRTLIPPAAVVPVLAAACLAAACAGRPGELDPMEGRTERVPGIVWENQSLQAPDTVTAGVPFQVRVTTFGSSSCTRPAGATVELAGRVAVVTPLDDARSGICTDDMEPMERTVTLRFDGAGAAEIQVRGQRDVVLRHAVVVRP